MNHKQLNILWSISLLIIAVATLVISGSSIFDYTLPDVVRRCLGIIELVAIPLLVYSSLRRKNK